MKIAIYSPYLDTFGGGEKYMMTIAEVLSSGNSVDVFLDKHLEAVGGERLKDELSKRFNLNLQTVRFIKAPVGKNSSHVLRMIYLKKYGALFYLTDGSIFYPTARKNFLHIQSPLVGQPAKSLWGKIKLTGWDLAIYNSLFTQQFSRENWKIKSRVIYPPVGTDCIKPLIKKKYILSVGRFFGYLKDKKHKELINAFKSLCKDRKAQDWSLHLVGSAGEGDQDYITHLKNLAKDIPVNFYPNLGYDELIKLYGQSSIYWHAAGFEEVDPTKMEHFGIATVEAMAGGCVPVVIGKGGQKEIVEHEKTGFLWDDLDQLQKFTIKLITDESLWTRMSNEALSRSKDFNRKRFQEEILSLIQK